MEQCTVALLEKRALRKVCNRDREEAGENCMRFLCSILEKISG